MIDTGRLPVISGFGFQGLQVYYKSNVAFTPLHDEIGYCEAVNLMLKSSVGVAFWLGVHLSDMHEQHSRQQTIDFMVSLSLGDLLCDLMVLRCEDVSRGEPSF
eukprot:GILJ01046496.1.p1 GENE.GILJ01046496.1~~GILJ01046496.1.p1  ORF type:complete len:103 (+),score=8.45 GILJ01046496.1:123-431(+)